MFRCHCKPDPRTNNHNHAVFYQLSRKNENLICGDVISLNSLHEPLERVINHLDNHVFDSLNNYHQTKTPQNKTST